MTLLDGLVALVVVVLIGLALVPIAYAFIMLARWLERIEKRCRRRDPPR